MEYTVYFLIIFFIISCFVFAEMTSDFEIHLSINIIGLRISMVPVQWALQYISHRFSELPAWNINDNAGRN